MNQQNQTKQDTTNSFMEVFSNIALLIVSFILSGLILGFISLFFVLNGFIKYIASVIIFFSTFFGLTILIPYFQIYLRKLKNGGKK